MTSKLSTVSVIIPVFNDAAGLCACLAGLARQTWPLDLIEVIVVDNASDPPIAAIPQQAFRLTLTVCAKAGSYAARNAGALLASGEVLAFTDADCVPDADWLKQGVERLLEDGEERIVGGDVVFSIPDQATATALYQLATGFGQHSNVRDKGFAATANLFCTLRQFHHVGPFDERLLSGGDREWAWRATTLGLTLAYADSAIVRTPPRSSFFGAVRQARRVAAGRVMLQALGLTHAGSRTLARQRSTWASLRFILDQRDLSLGQRCRVLCVAITLRAVYAAEGLRLKLGASPERR